ncbi:hypothetical protein NP493_324g03030 [Ridgeia piscesae]|uniref:Uncharacterized protein n=1 Tax=Ridgeia piscesae TaxID=27915 RepID=A0AAD9L562_RIDPI|nr:hypothetical protein NP493_324g03030 [Ridgeia piscesae]
MRTPGSPHKQYKVNINILNAMHAMVHELRDKNTVYIEELKIHSSCKLDIYKMYTCRKHPVLSIISMIKLYKIKKCCINSKNMANVTRLTFSLVCSLDRVTFHKAKLLIGIRIVNQIRLSICVNTI